MHARLAGGFTLIEVLVAVLLLAIGVVGAAATQLAALRTRQGSGLRSDAVQLASSLAERMRANSQALQGGDGANPYLSWHYDAVAGAPPAAAPCHGTSVCTSDQLALFDLHEVARSLHTGFPGGRASVCRDATMLDAAHGRLAWECAGAAGAPIVIKVGWQARGGQASTTPPPAVAIIVDAGRM